ncbi:MAG: phosphotransferase [Candidatus Thalassarchaeum sp.]
MSAGVSIEDSRWLADLAGLSDVESITPMEGGWDNSNNLLKLTDGGLFVLKIWHAQRNLTGVDAVINRQIHVERNGIPTSVPIQLTDGGRYAVRDGVAWTLLPYVEGGHLSSDPVALESLGETMARMHEIPLADYFPRDYRMGWILFESMYEAAGVEAQWPEFLVQLKRQGEELRGDIPEDLPEGVLHGDLFPDNVLGGAAVAAIIDFEEAWIGPRAFDLVMAFVGFGWQDGVPRQECWGALLNGYESVSPLTESEKEALPALYRYATLSIAAWRYWKHVMSEPDSMLAERYLEMVDRLGVEFEF